MIVNEYKLNVSIQKSSKDAKCLYLREHRGKMSAHAWGTKKIARNLNAKL
jgi:hypothetical protein